MAPRQALVSPCPSSREAVPNPTLWHAGVTTSADPSSGCSVPGRTDPLQPSGPAAAVWHRSSGMQYKRNSQLPRGVAASSTPRGGPLAQSHLHRSGAPKWWGSPKLPPPLSGRAQKATVGPRERKPRSGWQESGWPPRRRRSCRAGHSPGRHQVSAGPGRSRTWRWTRGSARRRGRQRSPAGCSPGCARETRPASSARC